MTEKARQRSTFQVRDNLLGHIDEQLGEFFELGHEYQKCNHDDLPRLYVYRSTNHKK
jgi:hypothetical protein